MNATVYLVPRVYSQSTSPPHLKAGARCAGHEVFATIGPVGVVTRRLASRGASDRRPATRPPRRRCSRSDEGLRFPQTGSSHDATFELRFLAKEHPLALPVVDFVAVLIKLEVDSVPQVNGSEESRAVSPILAQRLLLKRLALPAQYGKRLRLSSLIAFQLTDNDVGPVAETFKSTGVLIFSPTLIQPLMR